MPVKNNYRVYDQVNAEIEREQLAEMVAEYEEETKVVLPELKFRSNCCFEPMLMTDQKGHGFCSGCLDNAVPYKTKKL